MLLYIAPCVTDLAMSAPSVQFCPEQLHRVCLTSDNVCPNSRHRVAAARFGDHSSDYYHGHQHNHRHKTMPLYSFADRPRICSRQTQQFAMFLQQRKESKGSSHLPCARHIAAGRRKHHSTGTTKIPSHVETLRSFSGRNLLQDDASSALHECACDQGYTKAALSTSILLAKKGVVYIGSNASYETVTPCWPCDAVRVIETECFDVVCAEDTRACGPVRREPSRTQQVTRNVLRVLLTRIWKMWLQHLRHSVCAAQHMLNLSLAANRGSTAYATLVIRAPTAAPAPLAQKHSTRTPQAQLSALPVP